MQNKFKIAVLILATILIKACYPPTQTIESKSEINDSIPITVLDTNTKDTQTELQKKYIEQVPEPSKSSMDVKEKVIIEMLSIIPEVSKLKNTIDSTSKGKSKLIFKTIEKPTTDNPNFYIKVLEKTEFDQILKLQFFVNSQNLQIKIYDPVEDLMMDLSTWQKTGGN